MWVDVEERPAAPRLAFLTMWVRPRRTVRALIDSGAERGAYVLAALGGIPRYQPATQTTLASALVMVAFGMAIAVPAWFITSTVCTFVGRYFGGTGDTRELRVATAWGCIGFVAIGVIAPLLGRLHAASEPSVLVALLSLAGLFAILVLLPWATVIVVAAIAEAHEFSTWRAVATLFVPGLAALLLAGLLLLGRAT